MPRILPSLSTASSSSKDDSTTVSPKSPKLHTHQPRSRTSSADNPAASGSTPTRTRFNSRDATTTALQQPDLLQRYCGDYSTGSSGGGNGRDYSTYSSAEDTLLPLECFKQQTAFTTKLSFGIFLSTYLIAVLVAHAVLSVVLVEAIASTSPHYQNHRQYLSWTVTNTLHLVCTMFAIHWAKGSYLEDQGELNALTVWEQLELTTESSIHMRRTLLLVPTVLSYVAIWTANFDPAVAVYNLVVWSIAVLAKMPFMNGVRIFGINRTAGIDDEQQQPIAAATTAAPPATDTGSNAVNSNNTHGDSKASKDKRA
jgi:ORMDL family